MSNHEYPLAADEQERIAKLRAYDVFNNEHDPAFARLTELVKLFFDIPIVTITFMDERTQYLRAPHGLQGTCTTSREVAICNYTVLSNDVFMVPDLAKDSRFIHNSLISQSPNLRFYAGAPILLYEDNKVYRLGSLCLMDTQPNHTFDDKQAELLTKFAAMAADALELQKSQRLAKRDSKMKSKFLANMSHEIRTPMNGIVGMIEMLDDTELNLEQKSYIDSMKISTEHLLAIINGILDLSKVESGKMTLDSVPMDLSVLCNEVVDLFAVRAQQRGLSLSCRYPSELSPYVQGDPVRLKQVLSNLVNNAIKFTRKGGSVSINIHATPHCDNTQCSYLGCREMTLCIEVADTGVGIKPKALENIFEAYNQADNSVYRLDGGTGLGLSVCKSLVTLMGGHIWVTSVVGEGSVFKVLLPIPILKESQYKAWQCSHEMEHQPVLTDKSGHILLAEDDNVNAMVAKKVLHNSGHRVTHVTDGQSAIEEFSAKPECFDIILMDHHMPIMDGIQATTKLRELYDPTELPPIIALTANAMDGEREKYLQAGMQDYCTKPFKKEKLATLVQYWLVQKP
ncbi:GAF domain-containing hybrid sensor histidine kinase/response regulator [Psychrobacter coccoides]|uniref:GAF domain-containing hybrid sensor histidine kinase/response regulator n=1 Tax=Psychrobacter coccoides TaxID=2818440 RepID=UPI00311CD682